MAVLRHLGGAKLFLCSRPGTKEITEDRLNAIRPLLELQPYIHGVERYDETTPTDFDFTGFRAGWGSHPHLVGKQAAHLGIEPHAIDLRPWLTIPEPKKHNKIVICRSARNKGALHWFRWWSVRPQDCIFLGIEEDYQNFCLENCPWPERQRSKRPTIEFRKTANLLEAAQIIAGSRLFICNQTALLWVAMGMGFAPIMIEKTSEDSFLPAEGRTFISAPHENPTPQEVARF